MLGRRSQQNRLLCSTSSAVAFHNHRRNHLAFAFSSSPQPVHAGPSSSSSPAPAASPSSSQAPASNPALSSYGITPIPLTSLTPVERIVHVFAATATNFVNGFIFGGLFGFVSGAWSKRSIGGAFKEAGGNGRSWAGISAVYAGLQTASKVIRQKDDRYNAIVGACGSGAAFSAKNGPAAAAQGCVTFAALSYFLDSLSSSNMPPANQSDEQILNKK